MFKDILEKFLEEDMNVKRSALERISETACLLSSASEVTDYVVGDCPHCIACKALGITKAKEE